MARAMKANSKNGKEQAYRNDLIDSLVAAGVDTVKNLRRQRTEKLEDMIKALPSPTATSLDGVDIKLVSDEAAA